jgi:osmotically-inducible protein OsmY
MKGNVKALPDAQLRHSVLRQLELEPEVSSAGIGVSVAESVVMLTGEVDTYVEKIAAERTIKRIQGVKAIANDLRVRSAGTHTDAEIAADAVRALEAHPSVPADKIKVTVRDGWVTLEGNVEWAPQKEDAEKAVEYLGGVRGIANQITMAPTNSLAEVKER